MREKLLGYSLDVSHKDGGPKARGFELILGITIEDVEYLEARIRVGVLSTPISDVRMRPPYGVQCEVIFGVEGLGSRSSRTVQMITGWELDRRGSAPRLTTAYLKP